AALGQFDAAEDAVVRAVDLGRRLMDAPLLGMALSSRARLSLRLGRLDEAQDAATEALSIYQAGADGSSSGRRNLSYDVPAGTALAHVVLGFVAELRGDAAEAGRLH